MKPDPAPADDRQPAANRASPADRPAPRAPGGIVHTYQRFDPSSFPSPTAPPPDMASAAMEHMLRFGNTRRLTPEELANAVRLDPSQVAGLGPSLDSLIDMLEERKRKILETYETQGVLRDSAKAVDRQARKVDLPDKLRKDFKRAVEGDQLRDLETIWYKAGGENNPGALELLRLMERMGEKYQVEDLAARYTFTGRTPLDVDQAIAIREELIAIDKLLEQLREALENAQVAIIDLDELSRFADEAQVEQLRQLAEQIQQMLEAEAARQGLERSAQGYQLSPQAMRTFQGKVLREIFSSLQAARSGRHTGTIIGDGAVELPSTRAYEFGDSAANMDIPQTMINAMVRGAREGSAPTAGPRPVRLRTDDIEVHRTRNNPRCATCVLMDMSGSMRYDGQYINVKRMALGLDALIRREYPGDHLSFIEVFSLAKVRAIADVPTLMPKPVTIHSPTVRLRADLSDPNVSESLIPPHFTNIQHALLLARRLLAPQDTPNKQIVLITDGLPTAHMDGSMLYLLYPPDPLTEEATMREALAAKRDGITINIFLLPSWNQSSEDIGFAHRIAESTGGRVFFTGGTDLDRFVLWDYVNNRRSILG